MKFSVKNIKTFNTSDGIAFSLTVYGDGKKLGIARNGGYGGPNEYEPNSLYTVLNNHAKTLPPITIFEEPMDHNDETFLEDLMHDFEIEKGFKSSLKKKVIFLKNKQPGVFTIKYNINAKETIEGFIKRIEATHMDKFDIKTILNNLDFDAGLKLYKESLAEEEQFRNDKAKALKQSNLGQTSPAMNF